MAATYRHLCFHLVAVVVGLVRAFRRNAEIIGLLRRERRQLHADLLQVQPRHFLVQLLRQRVDADLVGVLVLPQVELRQRLVREAVGHHEARMARRAAEVHQAAFGQHEDAVAVGEGVHVHLRLDVGPLHAFVFVQPVDLDLVVEVADVADDRLVLHVLHVLERDDVHVAGAGDVDIAAAQRVFDGGDFEAFHRGLQRVDRIDFGHDHARAHAAQRMRASPCPHRRIRKSRQPCRPPSRRSRA